MASTASRSSRISSAAERARLAAELETLNLKRGDVLVRQGELADALYVVVTGRFAVTVAGRRDLLAEVGPGQPVGEIAFLAGGVRTATVTALRDSLVLRLGRTEFEELSAKSPSIWRTLTVTLRSAGRRCQRKPHAASRSAPAHDHAYPRRRQRAAAKLRRGPVARVPAQQSHHAGMAGNGEDGAAAERSNRQRRGNARAQCAGGRLRLRACIVAEPELTPWSEKAIRQADLVLAVGMHEAGEQPNALERLTADLLPPDTQRLVLLHETRGPISGTARWLGARNIAMHHHVALDNVGDAERLYRFINGTALGLVACGGGAYCAAHIGLYKALVQSGLTFDIMGGTSGGGAMTAAFAMGVAPDDVDRATHDIFVTNRAMRRYTWPRYSLLDHTHYDRQLAKYYSGVDIEDLWIPYFCVSTNLSSYDLHRHRQGDLWGAVRATGSVPVLLPPYYTKDGQMLVDGAILDNVPIRVMHELKSGPNVVISFEVPELQRFEVDYRSLPGRNALLKAMLNPFIRGLLPRAPSVGTVLMRSMMANRQGFERHLRPEDLLLVPPFPPDMGILEWNRHSELMDCTYRWALDEVERLQALRHPALSAHASSKPAMPVDAVP